jgi:hypothetical protein
MLTLMPDAVGVMAAVVVGLVVVWAGAAKLVSGETWRSTVDAPGVPKLVLLALPFVEVALGSLAVVRLWVPVVPVAIAGMLALFTGWILVMMRRDVVPTCACFGSRSIQPVGWRHVARNAGLVALAAIAAFT